uniref:Uncharacterized protein n=1 Tax=Anguilla anguilla TaxID=7936 RepID=A0A0E9XX42_ANGAN
MKLLIWVPLVHQKIGLLHLYLFFLHSLCAPPVSQYQHENEKHRY